MIYLATDHAGFELKNQIKDYLETRDEVVVHDFGAHSYDALDDYPDYISQAAAAISAAPHDRAIIFGGSGQGEAMLANRFANVRATVYYGGPTEIISLSREHNAANILSLGARFIDFDTAQIAIDLWLTTAPGTEEKYVRRVKKAERFGGVK